MRLSLETYGMRKLLGDKEALKAIAAAGFDCVDFSFYWAEDDYPMYGENYEDYALEVRAELDASGLVCNQAHAPFSLRYGMDWNLNEPEYRKVVQSLHAAAILGADQIVVHSIGLPDGADEDEMEYNYRYYKSLEPYCVRYGVRIAVENLFFGDKKRDRIGGRFNTPEELCKIVKMLDSPWFVACVDLGHASLTGLDPEQFVAGMEPGLLKALHVQDTDFKADRHWLPFQGNFDWPAILSALKQVEYDGDMTFELTRYFKTLPAELAPDALTFAHKVGRYLIGLFDRA